MGRRKDLSSSATVEAAKRGEGDTSYCLVRAPRVDSLGRFSHATRLVARARESGLPTRAPRRVQDRDPKRPHTRAR
jgi:hypothetical protein